MHKTLSLNKFNKKRRKTQIVEAYRPGERGNRKRKKVEREKERDHRVTERGGKGRGTKRWGCALVASTEATSV